MGFRLGLFFIAAFSLGLFFAKPLFAVEDSSAIEIPQDLEGARDVMNLEEAQSAEEISEMMEEELSDVQGESVKDEYSTFVDSVRKIRMLKTESDVFSAAHKDAGKRVLTSFANGKAQRRFYDDDLRLDKVEYWRVSSSSAESALERVVTYNAAPAAGKLSSIFEKNYAESTETRTFYHENGNVKSRRKNFFDQDGALTAFEIYTCSYDSSWRVVQDRLQKYAVEGKNVSLVSDEVHVTKYSGNNVLETSYYKNSILRVRTFYIEGKSDEYARATYFDGGIIVRDFYRGNIKISSTIDNGEVNEN